MYIVNENVNIATTQHSYKSASKCTKQTLSLASDFNHFEYKPQNPKNGNTCLFLRLEPSYV